MRRVIPVLILGLVFITVPGVASADPQSILSWDTCALGGGAVDKTDACDSDAGSHRLIISLRPNGVIPDVNGVEGMIDIHVDGVTIPDYWGLHDGGARYGTLSADVTIGESSPPLACPNAWSSTGGQVAWATFQLRPEAGWGRLRFIAAIPGLTPFDGSVTPELLLIALNIQKSGSTTATGCSLPACLTLGELRLTRPAATPGGDVFICPGVRSYVRWQGGGSVTCPEYFPRYGSGELGNVCGPVPVVNRTWGMVKQMYR